MKILIVTVKSWNIANAEHFQHKYSNHCIKIISINKDFSLSHISSFNPDWIFFPHWSWIIPKAIHEKYPCVVFHMTDLPYGRGGSPLQNLIVQGKTTTKLSALKVTDSLDAGPIYMKEDLDLYGNATDILKRASSIVFEKMIPTIILSKVMPVEQSGEATVFNRRKSDQGSIGELNNSNLVYDYIRMLDGEGYPRAFLDFKNLNLQFFDANIKDNVVTAKVEIRIKQS